MDERVCPPCDTDVEIQRTARGLDVAFTFHGAAEAGFPEVVHLHFTAQNWRRVAASILKAASAIEEGLPS